MRKLICLMICLGILALGGTAIAGFDRDEPYLTTNASKQTIHFRVFRFYDPQMQVLCYSHKNAITCIPSKDLSMAALKELTRLLNLRTAGNTRPILLP